MTNLTKPPNNMLIRTNSFMKPASQLQNRPLLRRSITGMGAFLLSNKHEFKKEDNNKKNRNKNQSTNNYIISDQFDPTLSKKSKQNNNNNNNDYEDEDEDLHKFDLYKSSPTLFYIKEKYKMYLEWLNEKSNKENHQQLLNSSTSTDLTPQLNWYNYEKIVYLNETSCLDYLKYIQSSNSSSSYSSSSSSPESITIDANIPRKESIPISSINRMSSSSMSFNTNKQIIKNKNKVRSISQQEMTCNTSKASNMIPKQCSDTILITNLNSVKSNTNNNNNTSLKNLLNKLSNNNNNENCIFENSQKLTKEVKFDQSFSITNSTITTTTSNNANPISILKPILKTSSIMNNSTNEYYFNNNNLKTTSPREQFRRVSVLTINNSNNNNNNNNNTTASKSLSNLKLPPIVNASDDFQAVMNDLLSSNE